MTTTPAAILLISPICFVAIASVSPRSGLLVIEYTIKEQKSERCVASLIRADFALTNARCTWEGEDLNNTYAIMYSSSGENETSSKKGIKQSFMHPCFGISEKSNRYGIGLYELASPFETAYVVKLVESLQSVNAWDRKDVYMVDWKVVIKSDWYKDEFTPERIFSRTNELLYATGKVVPYSDWNEKLYSDQYSTWAKDIWLLRVKGASETDWCVGDTGGPLLHSQNNEYIQIGVALYVHYSNEFKRVYEKDLKQFCYVNKQIHFYARIDKHINWINDVTKQKRMIGAECEYSDWLNAEELMSSSPITSTSKRFKKVRRRRRRTTTSKAKEFYNSNKSPVLVFLFISMIASR